MKHLKRLPQHGARCCLSLQLRATVRLLPLPLPTLLPGYPRLWYVASHWQLLLPAFHPTRPLHVAGARQLHSQTAHLMMPVAAECRQLPRTPSFATQLLGSSHCTRCLLQQHGAAAHWAAAMHAHCHWAVDHNCLAAAVRKQLLHALPAAAARYRQLLTSQPASYPPRFHSH
jgi:hypothetical protein